MSAFTSIESVTSTATGESRQLNKATAHHTMIVTVDGTLTNCAVYLEGSHDGYRWAILQTFQNDRSGMISTNPNGAIVMHIRARIALIQGSNGAQVSASIASADDA